MKKIIIVLWLLSLVFLTGCVQEVTKEKCDPVTIEKEVLPETNSFKISPAEEGYNIEVNVRACKREMCDCNEKGCMHWCWYCPK